MTTNRNRNGNCTRRRSKKKNRCSHRLNCTVQQINMKMKRKPTIHAECAQEFVLARKQKRNVFIRKAKWAGKHRPVYIVPTNINYIYTLFNLHSIIFPLFRVRATRASDSLRNKMKSYGFRPLWPLTVDHSCPIRRCASMFVLAIAMKSEITCRNVDLVKNTNWSKTLPLVHAKTKHLKHFCFLFVALRFVCGSQRWRLVRIQRDDTLWCCRFR